MREEENTGLSLEQAMRRHGDPALVAEFESLEAQGYPIPIIGFIDFASGRFDSDPTNDRARHLKSLLEQALLNRLRSGELYATGFVSGGTLGCPAEAILPDR